MLLCNDLNDWTHQAVSILLMIAKPILRIVADITSRESNTNLDTMYSYFYLVTTIYTITWGLEPIEP